MEPQCTHLHREYKPVHNVNTIRQHLECKSKQRTFGMQIHTMRKHLLCKSKQCTSYACASKACARKTQCKTQCKHLHREYKPVHNVNAIRQHLECKSHQSTFGMQIHTMRKPLLCRSKQCTSSHFRPHSICCPLSYSVVVRWCCCPYVVPGCLLHFLARLFPHACGCCWCWAVAPSRPASQT